MWIARNKDGSFSLSDTRLIRGHIFGTCPTDNNGNPIENYWVCLDGSTPSPLYLNIFPNLTWEHEPIEVEISEVERKTLCSIKGCPVGGGYCNYYCESRDVCSQG